MQEQAKAHTSHRSQGDDDEKFETSPHRTLTGMAGFDRSQHHGRESRESIRPPSRLRQREDHRYGWDETADYKGKANLHPLQLRLDVCVFDHPQLVMHHGPMPAVPVGREMVATRCRRGPVNPLLLTIHFPTPGFRIIPACGPSTHGHPF